MIYILIAPFYLAITLGVYYYLYNILDRMEKDCLRFNIKKLEN